MQMVAFRAASGGTPAPSMTCRWIQAGNAGCGSTARGGAEGHHLHDPLLNFVEGCGGTVTPRCRHDTVFENVTVRGNPAVRVTSSGSGAGGLDKVGAYQKIIGIRGGYRTAAACRSAPLRAHRDVERVYGVDPAVLRDADVRKTSCYVEG